MQAIKPNSLDEQALARLLADPGKRREAFSQVIHHYQEQLYWQIRKLVIVHDDAADVLQNTFLKAWQALDNFRGDAKLSTWLYTIAHNESITFLNKRQAERDLTLDDPDGYVMDLQEADRNVDSEKAQQLLLEALALLPPKQRQVFNMRYYDELSYEEIAELTGTSVGALKASYHFAVEKISAHFKKNELFD